VLVVRVAHPARRLDPGEPPGRNDLGERGDHPIAAVRAKHQRLEAAAEPKFDDDAVDRCGHSPGAPEVREFGGLGETPPYQLARRLEVTCVAGARLVRC